MRAIWATSSVAVVASAFVGVLLGAYLHELHINERSAVRPSTPATTVQTQISTVIITVPGTDASTSGQSASPRPSSVSTTTPRQVANATPNETQGPVLTSPPPSPATTSSTVNCNPLNPLPPPSCQRTTTSKDKGPDRT